MRGDWHILTLACIYIILILVHYGTKKKVVQGRCAPLILFHQQIASSMSGFEGLLHVACYI